MDGHHSSGGDVFVTKGFSLMASFEKYPMLAEGYEKLTTDLKRLRDERPMIVEAIEEARAHGDLSENAEYHAAKERQGQVEASISEIEDKIGRALMIDFVAPHERTPPACQTLRTDDANAGDRQHQATGHQSESFQMGSIKDIVCCDIASKCVSFPH